MLAASSQNPQDVAPLYQRPRLRGRSEPRGVRTEPGLHPGLSHLEPLSFSPQLRSRLWGPLDRNHRRMRHVSWKLQPRRKNACRRVGSTAPAPRPRALLPTPLSPARPTWRHGALHFLPSWLLLPRTRRGPECTGGFG